MLRLSQECCQCLAAYAFAATLALVLACIVLTHFLAPVDLLRAQGSSSLVAVMLSCGMEALLV
jgi:hypothetical protein